MKYLVSLLILLLLSFSIVFSQQQGNVIEPIQENKGFFGKMIGTFLKYWIWFVVIIVAIIIVVFIFILIKKMKKRVDPFLREYKKVKNLCKFMRDPTIKYVYMVSDKNLTYLGKYLGECITNDGYKNILLWKFKKWYLFWIPTKLDFFDLVKDDFIIRCNLNRIYKYKFKTEEGKEEIKTIELAHDIVYKDGDKIVIKGYGLEKVKYFFYPILKDKDGNIVDKKLEIFTRERDSALIDTMYEQVEEFANVSRELININPSVRYFQKTGEPIGKRETS